MRIVEDDRRERRRDCRTVQHGETFLRLQRDGRDTVQGECFRRGQDLLASVADDADLDIGMTREGAGDVREGREISARRDRTPERDHGKDVVVDQTDEGFEDRPADGRVAAVQLIAKVSSCHTQ